MGKRKKRQVRSKTITSVPTVAPLKKWYHFSTAHRWYIGAFVVSFLLVFISIGIWYKTYILVESDVTFESTAQPSEPPKSPVNTTNYYPNHLTAEGILVVDVNSAAQLFSRNPDKQMAPASITKIMTALVAIESYALDDIVTVQTATTEGRLMGLVSQESITVENLLFGALVHSGNDAALALAQAYPGGTAMFVAQMNTKAQELGLTNTHFGNPMGFDDEQTFTTPRDLLVLAREVLQHKELAKMVAIPSITVSDVSYSLFHPLRNVNELVGKVPGVAGIKTGFTQAAGESVLTLAQRNNHKVLIVVLKSANRFAETEELINWVFTNYSWDNVSASASAQVPR